MARDFLIADTHFGHKNIIVYENRPFTSVEEQDNTIIKNWNDTVGKDDKIFMLGDFALANKERIIELISMLNGYKTLVMGNHDRQHSFEWWQEAGFDMVSKYPIVVDDWYILSHEPLYTNTNMPYANIFGHVHGNTQYKDFSKQHFCVSCERINYTPIDFGRIKKIISDSLA